MNERLRQTAAVFRRELRKTLFARRGWWVYLLAAAPFLLFAGYNLQNRYDAQELRQLAAQQQKQLTTADFATLKRGMPETEVVATLGPPPRRYQFIRRRRTAHDRIVANVDEWYRYTDGDNLYSIAIENGRVIGIRRRPAPTLQNTNVLFATVFQFFYLRLAVFFGCLGIFMNLFRGEMLDKSLHFYFLAPVPREIVLAGKYLAGLVAAVVIFGVSTALQILLLGHEGGLAGMGHMGAYLGLTALGCLGYGAVFLAAGLVAKNPILPAAGLLIWESINPFLPTLLKKFSVIYYLGQLSPVKVMNGPGISPLFALMVQSPDAISPWLAILGLLLLTTALLAFSLRRVALLEIDYSSD